MPSSNENLERIFNLAFDAPSTDRAAILERECGDDRELRLQLERMLAGAEDDRFLAAPSLQATIQSFGHSIEMPGTRIGPYTLLNQIGEGGFGIVFVAEQEQPVRRKVALKIIKLGMDTQQVVTRFEQERQALALMDHPNVARVYDAGATYTCRPYFVMELCAGESITSYCDTHRLTITQRLDLIVQVCNAVQHAHQKGLIHRDIKPSNILVSSQDGKPYAKIIDFGIAKATASKLTERTLFTEHRQLIGTPEYMSPEQADGSPDIDTRTDVYSLGVLIYELLTGGTPFDTRALRSAAYAEIQRIIREVDPPAPSTRLIQSSDTIAGIAASRDLEPSKLGATVRGELDWIVMKALEKDRQRRYQSAHALGSDVQRYLAGEAVMAAPVSRIYQIRKFTRRNRSSVTAAVAVFFALGLGAAGFAWQAHQARIERDRAESERDKALVLAKFLTNTLSGVSPAMARGRDATMLKEMMDAAAAQIENGELKNAPEAEVRLRGQIGNVYRELLQFPQAEKMLAPAVGMARTSFAGDHLFVAELLSNFSLLKRDQQDIKAAEPFCREALAMCKRLNPGDSELTAELTNNLGLLRKGAGDLDGAASLYRESLAMWKRLVRGDHSQVALVEANLGTLMWSLRKLDDAETHLRASIEMNRRLFGDFPVTAGCLARLSSIELTRKNFAAAERLALESLDMRRRLYGTSPNREVADSLNQVGIVRLLQQNYRDAEPILAESIAAFRESMGRDSPTLVTALLNLATAQFFNAKWDDAEKTALDALGMQRRLVPGDSDTASQLLNSLTNIRRARGDLSSAERYGRESVEISRRLSKGDQPNLAESIYTLSLVLEERGSYPEAEALLRESLEMHQRLFKDGHPLLASAQAELAFVLTQQGNAAGAEPLARDAVAMLLQKSGPQHRHTGGARLRLGQSLLAQGKFADAGVELEAAYKVLSTAPGVSPSRLRECINTLVTLFTDRQRAEPEAGFQAVAEKWKATLQALSTSPTTMPQ